MAQTGDRLSVRADDGGKTSFVEDTPPSVAQNQLKFGYPCGAQPVGRRQLPSQSPGGAHDGRMLTSKDVMNKTLTPTQFHAGYDEREVDDMLDQVAATLRYYEQGGQPGPQAPASPTLGRRFTSTKFRRGYDEREVDDFLAQATDTLRYYEQSGRPDPQARASMAASEPEGLGQRALRWLRGDPRS